MNEEEKQTEVIEEGKESTEKVETKSESLASPKPYKNKDREDVWKEDDPNNEKSAATVDKDTEETSKATPDEQRPAGAEEKCLRNAMTTLNAITIQPSESTKMNF